MTRDEMDYSISWAYIVDRMKSRFGLNPDNEDKLSFGEIEKYLGDIWVEYFEILYQREMDEVRE